MTQTKRKLHENIQVADKRKIGKQLLELRDIHVSSDNEEEKDEDKEEIIETMFGKIVYEAGLRWGAKNDSLLVESVLFKNNIYASLRVNNNGKKVDEFLQGLDEYTMDHGLFKKALLPVQLDHRSMHSLSNSIMNESWMKLLLGVDLLQPKLMDLLLEKLPEFLLYDSNSALAQDIPKLIMQQFRWLDHIMEPKRLTDKLMQMLSITPLYIQREIITYLPEIINDNERKMVVKILNELMISNSNLMLPILDAFTNLATEPDSMKDAVENVLNQLSSSEIDHIPVMIRFILLSADVDNMKIIIRKLRNKLDIDGLYEEQKSSKKINARQKNNKAINFLIFESLKSSMRFQRNLIDTWLNEIANINNSENHKSLDIVLLFIFHSIPNCQKKVESLLKKKISLGTISCSAFESAILIHSEPLKEYFPSILSITDYIAKLNNKNGLKYAETLYLTSFRSFHAYQKQEIVGALISHIGSGNSAEINAALNVLLKLAIMNTKELAPFAFFIKGMLDYLENLSMYQIKILFEILRTLIGPNVTSQKDSSLSEELHILVRKQLASENEHFHRIGILGGLSLMDRELEDEENIRLLAMIYSACQKRQNCLTFFYEELSTVMSRRIFSQAIVQYIADNISTTFQENYLCDMEEFDAYKKTENLDLTPLSCFNLDGEDANIMLKLLPVMNLNRANPEKMSALCPLFRILQLGEKLLNADSLENIDALIGCPIILFEEQNQKIFNALPTESKKIGITTLFWTANWFRELLNSFASQLDEDVKKKLKLRLRDLCNLETSIANLIPLMCAIELDIFETYNPISRFSKSSTLITQPVRKSKSTDDAASESGTDVGTSRRSNANVSKKRLSFDVIKPKLRSLNMQTISYLLRLDGFVEDIMEAKMANQEIENGLTFSELNHLLLEWKHTLLNVFKSTSKIYFLQKSRFNSETKDHIDTKMAIDTFISVVPILCKIIESIRNYTQNKLLENDGINDMDIDERMISCLVLCLESIACILNSEELQAHEYLAECSQIIKMLADRIDCPKGNLTCNNGNYAQLAFHFVENVCTESPALSVAVPILTILNALAAHSPNGSDFIARISAKAATFLRIRNNRHSGKIDKVLEYLLFEWIQKYDDPLGLIIRLASTIIPSITKDFSEIIEHPLLVKETVSSYYKVTFSLLVEICAMKNEDPEKAKDYDVMIVSKTQNLVHAFHSLVQFGKGTDVRNVLSACLKYSKLFVEAFLRFVMPFISTNFRLYKNEIIAILKLLQQGTRSLQIICSHTKVTKDIGLTVNVPAVKKSLEILLFRVKAMLDANNCISAFWIGNLKHRTIAGEEVSSQVPISDEEDNEDSDSNKEICGSDEEKLSQANESEASNSEVKEKNHDDKNTQRNSAKKKQLEKFCKRRYAYQNTKNKEKSTVSSFELEAATSASDGEIEDDSDTNMNEKTSHTSQNNYTFSEASKDETDDDDDDEDE